LKIEDAKRFVLSVIVNRVEFSQIEAIFVWNKILPPTKATFYNAQKELVGPICTRCETDCARRREVVNPGSIIAFDGSWSHRCQAKESIIVIIKYMTKKIVDYEIIQKANRGRPENYAGSSSGIEVEALRRLITRWKRNPKVVGYVHDCDSKASCALREAGWDIQEFFDPNHLREAYDRKWAKLHPRHLRGLSGKLKQ
jgi:hypothetical protein